MSQTSSQTSAMQTTSENAQASDLDCDYALSYVNWLASLDDNDISALYQPLPNDYFADKPNALKKQLNPIDAAVKKYIDAPIKPYIRRKDLNEGDIDAPEKNAIEIGVKFEF